jgi:adenylyltransferase/sulfurtransferase
MVNVKRFMRQLALPEIGLEGQERLAKGCVALIGLGGLGCPAARTLAAAGVGHLILIDGDIIQLHNLHRQTLFTTADVGLKKVDIARQRLLELNPDMFVTGIPAFFEQDSHFKWLEQADVVLDCSDRLEVRYLLDNWSKISRRPWIHAGLFQHEAAIAVFNTAGEGPYYTGLFPYQPDSGAVPPCEVAGVMPVLPAVAGNIQAQEAIRLLLGFKGGLQHRMLLINLWELEFQVVSLLPEPEIHTD